ncbi:hypothetical protein H9P43_010116 [Blastocladiella emersonii ATCC 22665]|nr:hypothetical protein H9P43_010116 [Blastocladiella emersonii ATCC 22665]
MSVARSVAGVYLAASLAAVYQASSPRTDLSAVGGLAPLTRALALQPADFGWRLWSVVTYPAVDQQLWSITVSAPLLYFSLRYFERGWTASALLKFLLAVTLASAAIVLALALGGYALLGRETGPVHGALGILSALLVAYRQGIPEHTIKLGPLPSGVRIKHLPFAWLLLHVILVAVTGVWPTFLLAIAGFLASWWYLRFVRAEDGIIGDRSDTFAFAAFFPDVIQPFLHPVLNAIYNLNVRLGLIKPQQRILGGRTDPITRAAVSRRFLASAPKAKGSADAARTPVSESDRRKALALKSLEVALQAKSASASKATN